MQGKDRPLRIGELAARAGSPVETIRYYERLGVFPRVPRSASGYRLYRAEHLHRLRFVRRCRALGFSLDEIKSLITLAELRDQPCTKVTAIARQHLADVRAKRAALDRLELALVPLVSACKGDRVADCKILEALADPAEYGKAET